jgi:hypothetical protein
MANKNQITGQISGFNHSGYKLKYLKTKYEEIKILKNSEN